MYIADDQNVVVEIPSAEKRAPPEESAPAEKRAPPEESAPAEKRAPPEESAPAEKRAPPEESAPAENLVALTCYIGCIVFLVLLFQRHMH